MTVRVRPKDRHLRRLIDVWRKVCAPVRGKAKRPSNSAKCRLPDIWTRIEVASRTTTPRYRCSHWLVLGVPLGSFLAVSTMADEARFAPVNGHPRRDSSLPNAISNRKARSSDRAWVGGFNSPVTQPAETIFIGSLATVFVKLWSHSCTQACGARGPSGRAQSQPASCGKSTGLHCSILLIPGNLKSLGAVIGHRQQQASLFLSGKPRGRQRAGRSSAASSAILFETQRRMTPSLIRALRAFLGMAAPPRPAVLLRRCRMVARRT